MARADVWIVFAVPRLSGAPAREGAGQKSPGRPVEISWKWLNLEHRAGRCTLAEFGEFVVALEQRETESNWPQVAESSSAPKRQKQTELEGGRLTIIRIKD
jgi:hypothetical protein